MEWFFAWMLESSLLVLMIFGIRKAFSGKIPYALTYALWLIVLLRFLIPVNFISTPVSVANIISQAFPATEDEISKATDYGTASPVNELANPVSVTLPASSVEADPSQSRLLQNTISGNGMAPGVQRSSDFTDNITENKETVSGFSWKQTAGVLWLSGAVILLSFFLVSNVRLYRKIKKNRVLYGQRKSINIYVLPDWKNPCLYGCFRPAIYLPKSLLSSGKADEEDVKQMIAHEYVHYRHGDHIWSMFRMILVSLYWFHPCVWLAASCSKKDAELFCDETTIRLLGEEKRFRYGTMLVRLAGDSAWSDFFCSVVPMSRRGKEMRRRICAISRNNKYRKWVLVPLGAILIATISVTCSTGIGSLTSKGAESGTDKSEVPAGVTRLSAQFVPSNQKEMIFYFASTPEEAFYNYIQVFTGAVNTGNTSQMGQVMAVGYPVYEQQCNLVQNYFKRGIQEQIKSCDVSSVKKMDDSHVEIQSKENIQVSYADGSSRMIHQKYWYTCEQFLSADGSGQPVWKITEMRNASPFKTKKKS